MRRDALDVDAHSALCGMDEASARLLARQLERDGVDYRVVPTNVLSPNVRERIVRRYCVLERHIESGAERVLIIKPRGA